MLFILFHRYKHVLEQLGSKWKRYAPFDSYFHLWHTSRSHQNDL